MGEGAGHVADIAVGDAFSQQVVIEHKGMFLVFGHDQVRPVEIIVGQCPGQGVDPAADFMVMLCNGLPERIVPGACLFRD